MKLHKRQEDSFGLNTTSTADISFMLLVFFLVTSSMFVDKGLVRKLPPMEKDETQEQELYVERENIMALTLDGEGQISVNDTLVEVNALKGKMEAFILSRQDKHLFTIEADRYCPYDTYYSVQNALSEAYLEAREACAKLDYGRSMAQLSDAEREVLLTRLPHRVAEDYHSEEGQR